MPEREDELRRFYDVDSPIRAATELSGRRVQARDRAIGTLLDPSAGRLLDLGSGPGLDTIPFADAGFDVIGLDLSAVNAAAVRGTGSAAIAASVTAMPLRDDSIHQVWSMSVLMHLDDHAVALALREIQRITVTGAPVLLGTWGGDDVDRMVENELGARYFRQRSDATWHRLLEANLGPIQQAEVWSDVGGDTFHYQWTHVRAGAQP